MTADTATRRKDGTINAKDECPLYSIMQYQCRPISQGYSCEPIERIFRRCKGRPAVEVTHVVEVDRLGNVYLPPSMEKAMPRALHWSQAKSR